jgi:hypothetical protein
VQAAPLGRQKRVEEGKAQQVASCWIGVKMERFHHAPVQVKLRDAPFWFPSKSGKKITRHINVRHIQQNLLLFRSPICTAKRFDKKKHEQSERART